METYHWGALVMYNWDVIGCFIWDLFKATWKRVDGTSLLRPFETSLRCSKKTWGRRTTETSWWRSIEASFGVSFGTYLQRHWDIQTEVVTTSPQRLNAGWDRGRDCMIFFFFFFFFFDFLRERAIKINNYRKKKKKIK